MNDDAARTLRRIRTKNLFRLDAAIEPLGHQHAQSPDRRAAEALDALARCAADVEGPDGELAFDKLWRTNFRRVRAELADALSEGRFAPKDGAFVEPTDLLEQFASEVTKLRDGLAA